jgi:hypothetical protein
MKISVYKSKARKLISVFIVYNRQLVIRERITSSFLVSILMWKHHEVQLMRVKQIKKTNRTVECEAHSNEWTDLKILGAITNDFILVKSKYNEPIVVKCL